MKTHLSIKDMMVFVSIILAVVIFSSCSELNSPNGNNGIRSVKGSAKTAQKLVKQPSLFTLIPQKNNQLTTKQKSQLSAIRKRPTTAKVHIGRLVKNPSSILQKGQSVGFPVAPGKKFTAVGDSIVHASTNHNIISWIGSLKKISMDRLY